MAAELDLLIALYRRHGLEQAAEHLAIAKMGLEAGGALPPRLEDSDWSPTGLPAASIGFDEEYGRVRVPGPRVPTEKPQPLDELGLSRRTRNALVQSGFRTVAHVQAAVNERVLLRVRHIGKKGADEITAKLHGAEQGNTEHRQRFSDVKDAIGPARRDATILDEPAPGS